ncbi:uncharacterized protein TNCV_1811611 [Trichonephila clavipes]|nr:uncharacterized protein TNCV_1811611 [Trichonephila clavipes]
MEDGDAWPWKILWSDEVHFYLDGAVNSQNSSICGTSRPNVLYQQTLQSDYVTVWCGFTAEFIFGPFFSKTFTPQSPKRCSVTCSSCYIQTFSGCMVFSLKDLKPCEFWL